MPFNNGSATGLLFVQTADVTIASSNTETTLVGTGVGSMTLPINFLTAGKTLRVRARGYVSDTGTPTVRLRFKFGSTIIIDTGTVSFAGTIANNEWQFDGILTCRTTGVSGTVMAQGTYSEEPDNRLGLVSTTTVTIDTTASQVMDVTWQWGTPSSSNTITCTNLTVEALGI